MAVTLPRRRHGDIYKSVAIPSEMGLPQNTSYSRLHPDTVNSWISCPRVLNTFVLSPDPFDSPKPRVP